ncbi:MAG TPA: arylamine N-acetyltransferase [Luteitalea sp.]|nr:arylamine N-acetyltransferase [Luteitalea sp.]
MSSLTSAEARDIVAWLGVPSPEPSQVWLDALLAAYGQRVPWESASRIVRRARAQNAADCVQQPSAFWFDARHRGCGGTCFESNAALAALLAAVGIPSTFTLNDRPPHAASHTALLVECESVRYVVDAGFPLLAAVPLPDDGGDRRVTTPWGQLTASRLSSERIAIHQHPHPHPLAFELVDRPVSPRTYQAATRADYGPSGLFLDRVIIKKIIDGDQWRFASSEPPWVLECFRDGERTAHSLPTDLEALAAALSTHFAIEARTVHEALIIVDKRRAERSGSHA